MSKEMYNRFMDLADALNDCSDELFSLAYGSNYCNCELSDIVDILCSDLDRIVSELRQRLEFIEL